MWVVVKYKTNELNYLMENLIKSYGQTVKFYIPKIKYQKYVGSKLKTIEKFILGNYLIFHHDKFADDNILAKLQYTKGLQCILKNFKFNQQEIKNFINNCKKFEDKNGYLTQPFFNNFYLKKGKFINGPFTNMVFSLISEKKTQLKILIGNITTTISKKSGYLYRSI